MSDNESEQKHVPFIFEDHFSLVLAAPRKSGKSFLISSYLKTPQAQDFEHIIIMCPSLDFNDDYYDFSKNSRFKLIANIDNDIINDLYNAQSNCMRLAKQRQRDNDTRPKACPKTLLILDDCVDSGAINFRGVVDKIAERGRHINLSLIIAAQRISAVSRGIRENADYFIIFSPYSVSEMEQFLEQFVSRKKRTQLRDKLRDIFDTPHQFIMLDNTEKNIRFKLKTSTAQKLLKGEYSIL